VDSVKTQYVFTNLLGCVILVGGMFYLFAINYSCKPLPHLRGTFNIMDNLYLLALGSNNLGGFDQEKQEV
jgi:hypothetical protein